MTVDAAELSALLASLAALVPEQDRPVVGELTRRIRDQRLRVVVAGEAKRGKSTLVNALIGQPVLPTGAVPVTAVTTTLVHGDETSVEVRFDNRSEQIPLAALPEFVTEQGNPANAKGVIEVVVRLASPLLASGTELVDTPGAGSVYEHNSTEARTSLARMDIAVFVLTADPPISFSERQFLREVRQQAATVFCVLNKVDRLDARERDEVLGFTGRVLSEELGDEVEIWPLTAAHGGDDPGFRAFGEALSTHLRNRGSHDLVRSIGQRGSLLAQAVVEEQDATLATLALTENVLHERLARFESLWSEVERQRAESSAIAADEFARLLRETNEQAAGIERQERPPLLASIADLAANGASRPADLEKEVLEFAEQRIRRVVDEWRARRAAELDHAVARLEQRILERLRGEISSVRSAAADLFSLDLPDWAQAAGSIGSGEFTYAFWNDPGQLDALGSVLRRWAPGEFGRRRAVRFARTRAAALLDRQLGRARADFQVRLADSRRLLDREYTRRFHDGAGRISEAIARAASLSSERSTQVEASRESARRRGAEARALMERLASLARLDSAAEAGLVEG